MADYKRRRRSQRMDRFAAACAKPARDARIPALLAGMFRAYGGVSGVARIWREELDAARKTDPGSPRVLNHLMAMFQILLWSEQHPAQPGMAELTDDELEELESKAVLRTIAQHPQIAVVAAQTLGWTVLPAPGATQTGPYDQARAPTDECGR